MAILRIGILGASKIAPIAVIAPAKDNPSVRVQAVAARDIDRAKAFAARHGIKEAYGSYAEVLADPNIDLVYNSLPPKHHLEWTLRALQAGKHVLLEKPSCMNAAEAQTMVLAAQAAGRRLIEAFHYRYHPMFVRLLEIVRSELGVLRSAEAVFEVPIPKADGEIRYDPGLGGGALMDLGCYPIHWLRNVSNAEPVVVDARQELDDGGADHSTKAQLRFPSGLEASIACSMRPSGGRPMAALKIVGTDGELMALNPLAPQYGHLLTWKRNGGPERQETLTQRSTYEFQLEAVVSAIEKGISTPTEGQDIVATMRAIDEVKAVSGKGRF